MASGWSRPRGFRCARGGQGEAAIGRARRGRVRALTRPPGGRWGRDPGRRCGVKGGGVRPCRARGFGRGGRLRQGAPARPRFGQGQPVAGAGAVSPEAEDEDVEDNADEREWESLTHEAASALAMPRDGARVARLPLHFPLLGAAPAPAARAGIASQCHRRRRACPAKRGRLPARRPRPRKRVGANWRAQRLSPAWEDEPARQATGGRGFARGGIRPRRRGGVGGCRSHRCSATRQTGRAVPA
jgi:hypothetical protein